MSANILLDSLPETVEVDGREYFIDTDFRTFIIFEKVSSRQDLSNREKVEQWIDLHYTDERPRDITGAVNGILEIYRCGRPNKKPRPAAKNGNVEIRPTMIYDFDYDAPYIFGAFLSQYHIDLNAVEYLHWWKFQALFRSLNSDNKIVEIMGYRSARLDKIENKKERARIARLKEIYALPDALTTEEKVARAGMALGGAFF